jgi:flagellar operon protein
VKISGVERSVVFPIEKPVSTRENISIPDKSKQFQKTFESELSGITDLRFSNHAIDRLSDRKVRFNEQTINRLTKAVNKANQKGANQSLVLLDELAFLVSVKNKMVITALEADTMKEGVFTNIDSAVIG